MSFGNVSVNQVLIPNGKISNSKEKPRANHIALRSFSFPRLWTRLQFWLFTLSLSHLITFKYYYNLTIYYYYYYIYISFSTISGQQSTIACVMWSHRVSQIEVNAFSITIFTLSSSHFKSQASFAFYIFSPSRSRTHKWAQTRGTESENFGSWNRFFLGGIKNLSYSWN